MVTRHQFLERLHELLQPQLYVETGVHTGDSLRLARCQAIGIDPNPMVHNLQMNQTAVAMTSDDYFGSGVELPRPIDLGFIDGMHWHEYAWRDFLNMEQRAHPRGVIVFDDMMPMTQHMTNRNMVAGDWTGDVWKVYYMLKSTRDDLAMALVDTFPTGTLVVWDLDPSYEGDINLSWGGEDEVPDEILFRTVAFTPEQVIEMLAERL